MADKKISLQELLNSPAYTPAQKQVKAPVNEFAPSSVKGLFNPFNGGVEKPVLQEPVIKKTTIITAPEKPFRSKVEKKSDNSINMSQIPTQTINQTINKAQEISDSGKSPVSGIGDSLNNARQKISDYFTKEEKPGEYSRGRELRMGAANFLQSFGAGLQGRGSEAIDQYYGKLREQHRASDPNSDISKIHQHFAGRLDPTRNYSGMSAADIRTVLPYSEELIRRDVSMARSGPVKIKDANEAERKNLGFYERMKNADANIENLSKEYTGNEILQSPEIFGNVSKSKARQLAENAKRDWMIANLRKESGAAISPQEFESQDITYFPQRGDSAETVEQKRIAREQIRRNTFLESGNAGLNKHAGNKK